MDHLLNSRMSADHSPSKLENLSPEKYGKAAYATLTFTPSKLVDNVLYRQASTFKKVEEESSKVRQSQATISILKDRLNQLGEEKEGIESTLTQQIIMYKKMLSQNEGKHEQRVKDIQRSFSEQMQKLAISKEQQAKYAQSEKEMLENRIEELEAEVADLKDKLNHGGNTFGDLSRKHEKLEIHYKNVCDKLEETENKLNAERQRAKADYEELSRKLYNTEVDFRGQLDKAQLDRERQKENMERFHRSELEKVENKRIQQAQTKNQELKQLNETFNSEMNRMNGIINNKEKHIENLNAALNDEKERILNITRNNTAEVSDLVHDKNRLKEEVDNLNLELAEAREERKSFQVVTDKKINSLENAILNLKEELQISEIGFIREKDKSSLVIDDLHRQILALKAENDRAGVVVSENNMLCKQIRNLKDLLLESSLEMERCKEEFLRIGREKDHLAVKVRQLGFENQNLHRIKYQKEEEARGWRESYYMSRRG